MITRTLRRNLKYTQALKAHFGAASGRGNIERHDQPLSKLNPNKHVYMHHNMNDSYDDYFTVGEFPIPDILATRMPSTLYRAQAIQTAFAYLSENVEGVNLQEGDFETVQHHSWQVHNVDIDALKYNLCSALAQGLVIRENKNRPNIERRLRDRLSRVYYGEIDTGNESIADFFDHYDVILSELVQSSNFYRAREVPGKLSWVEQESVADDSNAGIQDLTENNAANNNLINRFIRMIHS